MAGAGVPALAQPRQRPRRAPGAAPGARRPDRRPDRGGARRGPCGRHRPPGREAGQHPDRPRAVRRGRARFDGEAHRLRHLARRGHPGAHLHRSAHRHPRILRPRDRARRGHRRAQRRLLPRRHPVRRGRGPAAVRHGREQRPRAPHTHRAGRRTPAATCGPSWRGAAPPHRRRPRRPPDGAAGAVRAAVRRRVAAGATRGSADAAGRPAPRRPAGPAEVPVELGDPRRRARARPRRGCGHSRRALRRRNRPDGAAVGGRLHRRAHECPGRQQHRRGPRPASPSGIRARPTRARSSTRPC